ncbi:MAG: leucine-rich repeat protein [Oscillospiraceae bacterium]|nr:leucine-rich repeat protein [Oscillospiraceae bacterium]
MKRIFGILLCFSLLLSLLPAAVLAAEETAELSMVVDLQDVHKVDPQELLPGAASRGKSLEDNLVFPGPLVEKGSYTPDGTTELPLGVMATGKPGQYMCMAIYTGPEPVGEPIATDYATFSSEEGYGTYCLYWRKNSIPTGRYTLVTFTAELQAQTLYPVENTAFMTDLYVHETYQYRWHSFVMEPDTWEKLDTIQLVLGQPTVLAAGRSPLPSYGIASVSLGGGLIKTEEAGGYFFITPLACGTSEAVFRYGSGMEYYPLEVCYTAGGHHCSEVVPAGDPSMSATGYNLHICDDCGTIKKEVLPSYAANFANFRDVPENSWYFASVMDAVYRNLFNGVSKTAFGPDRAMTRGMLVTVLWRYEGQPAASQAEFNDVSPKDWYAEAVNWAAEQEIVNGVGKGRFNPNGTITREQLATILFRYARKKALDTTISGDPAAYPDVGDLSSWATDAISWALGHKLVSGVGKGGINYLMPQGDATRAQVSAILVRFIQNLIELPLFPDLTTALDGGKVNPDVADSDLTWAFYDTGVLQIGGTSPLHRWEGMTMPWDAYRDQITTVEFLYGTRGIWEGTFQGYPALETVIMADTVGAVYKEAFYNCPKLTQIHFSPKLTSIGESAFRQCSSLKEVHIPDSCPVDLGPYSFADNAALEQLILGKNVRSIGYYAFKKCTVLKEVDMPDSILPYTLSYGAINPGVGTHAFYGCYSLERAKLPFGLTKVYDSIFFDCTSLKEVTMPYAAYHVEHALFRNCTSLESVVFSPLTSTIKSGIFIGCTSLKELYFLNDHLQVYEGEYVEGTDEDHLPFGDPETVVVYGIPDSVVQTYAETYGHQFKDITELVK